MTLSLLLEGPFESHYSLAVINRCLARAFVKMGTSLRLHQRDNTCAQYPSGDFLRANPDLAPLFVDRLPDSPVQVHSRYIYPPYTDTFARGLRTVHCYGWEESSFPSRYVADFNRDLDLITVMSAYVRQVLLDNGVTVPIQVAGLGADHILECPPQPAAEIGPGFVFLHVSSCFPRKAPEILVQAFCQEFTRRDDARLVIATFENPHNRIREIVQEVCSVWPAHAPIQILQRPFSLAEIRWLYEHANCLVSASRGEGFGMPVAEAMLVGCPVMATLHGGQADTCTQDNCWPVEYRLEQARTHLTEGPSQWAEPLVSSLRSQMRALHCSTEAERQRRTAAARKHVERHFTWAGVAARHWQACSEILERRSRHRGAALVSGPPCRIGFVTTWNTRCGIAEYSRYLAGNLPAWCAPVIFANRAEPVRPDENFVVRCWEPDGGTDGASLEPLIQAILESRVEALSVQFNFGFFAPSRLNHLIGTLRRHGVVTAITMHATRHENLARLAPALSAADYCFCHRQEEIERLSGLGLVRRPVLQRQGIPASPDRDAARRRNRRPAGSFQVACFGFFLPPKGIHVLIHAMALARSVNPLLCLNLLNALYPTPESHQYAAHCLALLREKGLAGCTSVTTEFLGDTEVLDDLAASDLVVLPYLFSSESSSAAVRVPVASETPIACSDLELFDEFSACLHRFRAGDALALANTILRLAANPAELHKFEAEQARLIEELAWPRMAARFAELIFSSLQGIGRGVPTDASQAAVGANQ